MPRPDAGSISLFEQFADHVAQFVAVLLHFAIWRSGIRDRWQKLCNGAGGLSRIDTQLFSQLIDRIAAQRLLYVIAGNRLVFAIAERGADNIAELTLTELVQNGLQATLLLNPLHDGDVIDAFTVGAAARMLPNTLSNRPMIFPFQPIRPAPHRRIDFTKKGRRGDPVEQRLLSL